MPRLCDIGGVKIGPGQPLAIIGGPCALESVGMAVEIGAALRDHCERLGLRYVFKASYDKANRTSVESPRGPGLDEGLDALATVRSELGVPVVTDIHEPGQARAVAEIADALQIPAFLCRQTDLLVAAAQAASSHGCAVKVKKGQFLSPQEMTGPVRKLAEAGCENVLLTERGTFFGYNRLVNDFIGLGDMMDLDCSAFTDAGSPPVCFDVTHSTQLPGSGAQTGGRPDRAPSLALAAVASGVHALFIESHPDPSSALSDGATQLPMESMGVLLERIARVRAAIAGEL